MNRIISLFITFFLVTSIFSTYAQSDTSLVDFDIFMQLVEENHPLSKQAELVITTGTANLKKAKGGFDPVIKSKYEQKQFGGKDYYTLNANQISVPTPLGIEFVAGFDNNSGVYVNPKDIVPDNGLTYAGIAVPIGKGLLFDERRQAVRQAEVIERSTVLESKLILNKLLLDASEAYWDWYSAWNTYAIYAESVRLAKVRLQGVKAGFIQGYVPAIDTLEAHILVQNRQLNMNDALIKMQKSKLEVSNFLWTEEMVPLILTESSTPINHSDVMVDQPVHDGFLTEIIASIQDEHPKIQLINNKLENLNYERRIKIEKTKPKLNFNYNLINEPVGSNPFENYSSNDFKWGFEFAMPILLRSGRGDLQLTKIKMDQTELELKLEQQVISNKIRAYHQEIKNIYDQIQLYTAAVNNYKSLFQGERRKFEEGESSLFVVNSRENNMIKAEVKLIELFGDYHKRQAALTYAIGGNDMLP